MTLYAYNSKMIDMVLFHLYILIVKRNHSLIHHECTYRLPKPITHCNIFNNFKTIIKSIFPLQSSGIHIHLCMHVKYYMQL